MAFKHALVVDDSRSARVSLKLLLEKYNMAVHFAESGEEAIEFLKSHLVDVIFMDHSMPGMDGFEAMAVIKADPRTATIPVMMYTAKEGEVYVGQARALGAVGVLPKQVQPGVLFDMLLKLGLVKDRRSGRRKPAPADAPPEEAPPRPPEDEAEVLIERQALGMSIQALIKRILEDQHLELRSDVLSGHREFARQVAAEIHARQVAEEERRALEAPPDPPPGAAVGTGALVLVALLALLPALLLYVMWSDVRDARDAIWAENGRLAAALDARDAELAAIRTNSQLAASQHTGTADASYYAALEALQWAANQGNEVPLEGVPFDDVQLDRLEGLLDRLAGIGFAGTIRMDSHLGAFCLLDDGDGGYRLADPELLVTDCNYIGHPLGAVVPVNSGQSVAFANFLASSPLLATDAIDIEVFAHGTRDSTRRYPFPPNVRTAGEWNQVAALNNRVEVTLLPR
jgi:CheY-like chemotaxis protein